MARLKRQGTFLMKQGLELLQNDSVGGDLEENKNAKRIIKIDPIVSEILMF